MGFVEFQFSISDGSFFTGSMVLEAMEDCKFAKRKIHIHFITFWFDVAFNNCK